MMTRISTILLLTALLLTGCNPLRKVQRNHKADSTTVDRSEIHKVVTDILKESGSLRQTVIEFYPPTTTIPPAGNRETDGSAEPDSPAIAAEPPIVIPPAVKRIVHTEINTEAERTTTTDSLTQNDIHTTSHSELSDKVVEKPPATVMVIKWIAVGLVALLLIILILKFPKIKL